MSRMTHNSFSGEAPERAVPDGTPGCSASEPGTAVPGFHMPPLRGLRIVKWTKRGFRDSALHLFCAPCVLILRCRVLALNNG